MPSSFRSLFGSSKASGATSAKKFIDQPGHEDPGLFQRSSPEPPQRISPAPSSTDTLSNQSSVQRTAQAQKEAIPPNNAASCDQVSPPANTSPQTTAVATPSIRQADSHLSARARQDETPLPSRNGRISSDDTCNVWALAFDDLEHSDPELMLAFKSSLAPNFTSTTYLDEPKQGNNKDKAVFSEPQNVADIALARIEAIQDAKDSMQGRPAQFRKHFEETVKIVLSAKDTISTVTAFNPYASSVWTCVCVVLPLFINSTTENEAAIEGLNYISILLLEYKWKERVYLAGDSSKDFISTARKLYFSILEYEASLYAHMHSNAAKRFGRNLLKAGDWKSRLESLKALDTSCRKVTDAITEARAYNWRSEERSWQQALLDQRRQKREEENLQKLYSRYESGKNVNGIRVRGTCEWFLKHPDFLIWRDSHESGLLWLTADPGCGKSVLAKYLVDRKGEVLSMNTSTPAVCYFFFKEGDAERDNASGAICALLHQLFLQRPHLYKFAASDFEKKGDKFLTDFDALWRILLNVINDESPGDFICVLDGLDECESKSRKSLISKLVHLQLGFRNTNDKLGTRKILTTSRPYIEIEREFRELTDSVRGIRLEGERIPLHQEINLVLNTEVPKLASKMNLSPKAKETLLGHLTSIENRTYLWLHFILEFLESQNEVKACDVPRLLEQIPADIEEAYRSMLEKIQNPIRARRLLHCVLGAAKPLELKEMNVLMNVDEDCHTKNDLELWSDSVIESMVKNICGLFVTVFDSRIYLIHQTARSFLICKDEKKASAVPLNTPTTGWTHTFRAEESALTVAKGCISFLSLDDFEDKTLTTNSWRMRNTRAYALFAYAAKNWPGHLAKADALAESDLLQEVICKLYKPQAGYRFERWIEEYRKSSPLYSYFPMDESCLLWAAYFGQRAVVKEVLDMGQDPNHSDHLGRTALFFGAHGGHIGVVNLLVSEKADAGKKDIIGQTPLIVALQRQHLEVSKALLEVNSRIDSPDVFERAGISYCGPQLKKLLRKELVEAASFTEAHTIEDDRDKGRSVTTGEISKDLKQIEEIIRRYLNLSHDTGLWKSVGEGALLVGTKKKKRVGLSDLYLNLSAGVRALNSGNDGWYEEGRSQILNFFTSIRAVMETESSLILVYITRMFAHAWHHKQQRLARSICRQIETTAITCHDVTYPLVAILSMLKELLDFDSISLYKIFFCVLQSCIETWTKLYSSEHVQVVYTRHIQLEIASWFQGPESVADELQNLSVSSDSSYGPDAVQSIQILVDLAQNLLDRQKFEEAKDMGCELKKRARHLLSTPRGSSNQRYLYFFNESLRLTAESETGLQDFKNAEIAYRRLIKSSEDIWGASHSRAREDRMKFGLWLMARGRKEEAEEYGISQ